MGNLEPGHRRGARRSPRIDATAEALLSLDAEFVVRFDPDDGVGTPGEPLAMYKSSQLGLVFALTAERMGRPVEVWRMPRDAAASEASGDR